MRGIAAALLLAASVVASAEERAVEGWAGRYMTFTRGELPQPGAPLGWTSKAAWQGFAVVRSPRIGRFRLSGQAMTAVQSGALLATSAETWDGAEVTALASVSVMQRDGLTLDVGVGGGYVLALGDDRASVSTTPGLAAGGVRVAWSAELLRVRCWIGLGVHEVANDGRMVDSEDCLLEPSFLGQRTAVHFKRVSGERGSWRLGVVARWW